ncbi:MAG: hypothetical protein RIS88_612 [Pseudomonadota bacterium]|jgi:hypothetical protein
MKVLDLKCAQQHVFEGWFASEEDFQGQRERGLVACPLCGDASVDKQLSAPRLNLGAAPAALPAPVPPSGDVPAMAGNPQLQAAMLKAMREAVARTEDVGERFAQVARQMHYGEVEEHGIRGRTSAKEAVELLEEGISVLPLPALLKEPLQ